MELSEWFAFVWVAPFYFFYRFSILGLDKTVHTSDLKGKPKVCKGHHGNNTANEAISNPRSFRLFACNETIVVMSFSSALLQYHFFHYNGPPNFWFKDYFFEKSEHRKKNEFCYLIGFIYLYICIISFSFPFIYFWNFF